MEGLFSGLLMFVIIGLFVMTHIKNAKTQKPDDIDDELEGCGGCQNVVCGHHPAQRDKEDK